MPSHLLTTFCSYPSTFALAFALALPPDVLSAFQPHLMQQTLNEPWADHQILKSPPNPPSATACKVTLLYFFTALVLTGLIFHTYQGLYRLPPSLKHELLDREMVCVANPSNTCF